MSFLYSSIHNHNEDVEEDEERREIDSRLYLWNYSRFKQTSQIKSILPFKSDSVCLLPRSPLEECERSREMAVINSNGKCVKNLVLQESSLQAAVSPASIGALAATDEYIFLTAPSVTQSGILQYRKENGEFVRVFAQDISNITDIKVGGKRNEVDEDLIYVCTCRPRHGSVLVYDTSGVYVKTLITKIYPISISFDKEGYIQLTRNRRKSRGGEGGGIIEVYNKHGSKIAAYGNECIGNPLKIACDPHDNFTIVLDSFSLAIFWNRKYLYSLDASENGISDFCITNDGHVWISVNNTQELLRINSDYILCTPPAPLSLLCQSAILVHLVELPFHLLPRKYTRELDKWSEKITLHNEGGRYVKVEGQEKFESTSKDVMVRARRGASHSTLRLLAEKKFS
ncbi:PREDICTED: uncharacterized protein LOC109581727 [Amphimedon queenslandica]|uniref:Uncharacterized protein n=1 Tax=Amphimedon queenslandica TaxID=400682 RepID=A0A1X7VU03_AMPQE|nr:PREDICTED: uncharacterized protein LOC109581727 [Amphimedon queenslandica]|eukprot:XP_019851653.1 PREDICTED: uncharacterized protein LOC109581727 [Amphimedon queenslandica]